jgi:hypothetical protein
MIIPKITDRDEWNYLDTLDDSDLVRHIYAADSGYYACVLQYKYPQCQTAILTANTFQVLQPGISAVSVQRTSAQRARQELFDALKAPFSREYSQKRLGVHPQ